MRLVNRLLARAAEMGAVVALTPSTALAVPEAPQCEGHPRAWTCFAYRYTSADGPFTWTIERIVPPTKTTILVTAYPGVVWTVCGTHRITYTLPSGETSARALAGCGPSV